MAEQGNILLCQKLSTETCGTATELAGTTIFTYITGALEGVVVLPCIYIDEEWAERAEFVFSLLRNSSPYLSAHKSTKVDGRGLENVVVKTAGVLPVLLKLLGYPLVCSALCTHGGQ